MADQDLVQKVKDLEETVRSFRHEIERLQAVNEIQNLMSKYEYLHTTNRHKEVIEMYAKNAPGVSVSMKEMGHWEGDEAPYRCWGHLDMSVGDEPAGMLAIHPTTTPIIEIARDGKTAKGVWIGTGLVGSVDRESGRPDCMWEWDRYGVDFIKENGKWKFWHFHVYTIFNCGWDDKWADQFRRDEMKIEFPDEFKPDAPPADSNPYRPDAVFPLIPALPEPYETFEQTFRY